MASLSASASSWRTPVIIITFGCIAALLTFGARSSLGFFQTPLISTQGWGRDTFAFALALQNLLWGLGQPFMGAIADRFGTFRVLSIGAILYASGLALMAYSSSPLMLDLSAGVLIGFGLSGCSFNIVLAAFGKLLPAERRSMAFGIGTAAGSFGQFLFAPLSVGLIGQAGWQETLVIFALLMLFVIPLSTAIATRPVARSAEAAAPTQSVRAALIEAFGHRSYVLLVIGFFTCGFQLAFTTVHLPAYLGDIGLEPWVGGWTIALIGAFNIAGSLSAGYLGNRMPKRWILAIIYLSRSIVTTAFLLLPASPASAMVFGALSGLLWLSTIPPTSSLIALMFGTRYMAMLYGFAFFSHQVGSFIGVWLGGVVFVQTGSYELVWWLSVALGLASAVINLPIIEKPVQRAAVAA